jgi:hypothetical protein
MVGALVFPAGDLVVRVGQSVTVLSTPVAELTGPLLSTETAVSAPVFDIKVTGVISGAAFVTGR